MNKLTCQSIISRTSIGVVVVIMLMYSMSLCSCSAKKTQSNESALVYSKPKVFAVQVNVTDIEQAIDFYGKNLGFEIVTKHDYPQSAQMKNEGVILQLYKVERRTQINPTDARTNINFRVENLDAIIESLKNEGTEIIHKTPQRAAVGVWKSIRDPFGNIINLMELNGKANRSTRPKVYNVTIKVTDIDQAVDFYCNTLGFDILSVKYYPPVIPLKTDGIISNIALHETAKKTVKLDYPNSTQTFLIIEIADPASAMADLKKKGVEFIHATPRKAAIGIYVAFKDPFGLIHELVEIAKD